MKDRQRRGLPLPEFLLPKSEYSVVPDDFVLCSELEYSGSPFDLAMFVAEYLAYQATLSNEERHQIPYKTKYGVSVMPRMERRWGSWGLY